MSPRVIDSNKIHYEKPELNDFLVQYNEILAEILVENFESFSYLASATINRLEAQTHFFERVEKYIQLRHMLEKEPELTVRLIDVDHFLYESLSSEFGVRVITDSRKHIKKWRFLPRYLLLLIYNLFFSLVGMLLARKYKKKEYDYIIRSYFDFRNVGERLREEYFGQVAEDLAKEYRTLVVFKLLQRKDLLLFIKVHKTAIFDACLLESFLSPWSVIKAFIRYLGSHVYLHKKVTYKGHDVTSLLQRSLDEDFYLMKGIGVYLEYEAAKKITELNPKRIMFPYENQTWEKVYPYVRKELQRDVFILGYIHSGFSYKLLIFFPTSLEGKLPIFPDKIVTMGEISTRILKEKASYLCEIVTGAALRQTKHIDNEQVKRERFPIKPTSDRIERKIAYAFSYDREKYNAIIASLLRVFKNTSILVYLKFHPDFDESDILRHLGFSLPSNFIPARSIPWGKIYSSVDLILYDDNSIGIEGIINGVKTFMYNVAEPVYNCERFFYFDTYRSDIYENDLIKICEELVKGTFIKEMPVEKISDYINQYYHVYTREGCFKIFTD